MTKSMLFAAAAALTVSAGVASAATPSRSNVTSISVPSKAPAHDPKLAVLYDQTANNSGIGIVSQQFESTYSAYDSQAADDFTVPKGATWTVKEVYASGEYFNGSGPATSENVTFYSVKKKLPGAVVMAFANVKGKDSAGSFTMKLPKGGVTLTAGTYFVSVQANLAFSAGGEWGWNTTNAGGKALGYAAVWENPNGGFGTGCAKYETETTCIPDGQGSDHIFQILGKSK